MAIKNTETFVVHGPRKSSKITAQKNDSNIQNYLLKLKNVPSCFSHGIHLHSEIMGLRRKFNNLEAVATSYSGTFISAAAQCNSCYYYYRHLLNLNHTSNPRLRFESLKA